MSISTNIYMSKTTTLIDKLNELRQEKDDLLKHLRKIEQTVKELNRQIEKISQELGG